MIHSKDIENPLFLNGGTYITATYSQEASHQRCKTIIYRGKEHHYGSAPSIRRSMQQNIPRAGLVAQSGSNLTSSIAQGIEMGVSLASVNDALYLKLMFSVVNTV